MHFFYFFFYFFADTNAVHLLSFLYLSWHTISHLIFAETMTVFQPCNLRPELAMTAWRAAAAHDVRKYSVSEWKYKCYTGFSELRYWLLRLNGISMLDWNYPIGKMALSNWSVVSWPNDDLLLANSAHCASCFLVQGAVVTIAFYVFYFYILKVCCLYDNSFWPGWLLCKFAWVLWIKMRLKQNITFSV